MQTLGKSVAIMSINDEPAVDRRRMVKNLLTQSIEEKRRFMQSFDDILSDCDGTVWKFEGTLDGVGPAVTRLEQIGKRIFYVTNNSMRTDEEYLAKFKASGIAADITHVIHPATATVEYLRQRNFKGLVYAIGSPVFRNIVKAAGFTTIDGPHQMAADEKFTTVWRNIKDNQPVGAVVLDTDVNLLIAKLLRAELYLKNPECIFVVGTTDMVLSLGYNTIMGPGHFYKALEQAIGRKAVIVGKPGPELADICVRKYNLRDRKRVLFIGDMLEQDIGFAKAAGFQSLVVLTGGTTLDSMQSHSQIDELPDYYLDSFADFSVIIDELAAAAGETNE